MRQFDAIMEAEALLARIAGGAGFVGIGARVVAFFLVLSQLPLSLLFGRVKWTLVTVRAVLEAITLKEILFSFLFQDVLLSKFRLQILDFAGRHDTGICTEAQERSCSERRGRTKTGCRRYASGRIHTSRTACSYSHNDIRP